MRDFNISERRWNERKRGYNKIRNMLLRGQSNLKLPVSAQFAHITCDGTDPCGKRECTSGNVMVPRWMVCSRNKGEDSATPGKGTWKLCVHRMVAVNLGARESLGRHQLTSGCSQPHTRGTWFR